MRKTSAGLACLLLIGATSGCAHTPANACAGSSADAATVAQTIKAYYAALAADDAAAAEQLTSPSFYAYDVGKRFTGPELSATIRQIHQQGTVLQWNIGSIDTHFDCNIAWAAWENVGAAGPAAQLKPARWLESAVLQRHRGKWLLEFLHSTRATQAQ